MSGVITVFFCGDVMTGRGIDQILPHPVDPVLYESYIRDARGYVMLAENVNGLIPRPVEFDYIWGDVTEELDRFRPDLRIINLETAVTRSRTYMRGKEVLYRMSPENVPCLAAARIDCCCLANNHILDWGYQGLYETLATLEKSGIKSAGAGKDLKEARAPAVLTVKGKGRVLLFSFGSRTSGVPEDWAAQEDRPGVNLLPDFSPGTVENIGEMVRKVKKKEDIVILSVHWGPNWGYEIASGQQKFAHGLIDIAHVDAVYGHSSHHVKGIEVYKGRPILYGCGDFLNDYEGIGGYEEFRSDLGLMYFLTFDMESGSLVRMEMAPTQIRLFRVNRASTADSLWLKDTLDQLGDKLGTWAEYKENVLTIKWRGSAAGV